MFVRVNDWRERKTRSARSVSQYGTVIVDATEWEQPPRLSSRAQRGALEPPPEVEQEVKQENSGVGNGNRTRNRRSHSPVLCQLSYSHRRLHYSNFNDSY